VRDARTLNTEQPAMSKRRARRSMDHYQHPDFDNYLLHQTHYYHSLNAFPKGSKFQKDLGMRGMMLKKNNFKNSLERSEFSTEVMSKNRVQSHSDKSMKSKKKRNNSSESGIMNRPFTKKGYPQLKGALSNPKTSSVPESAQNSGRKRRANSQCCSHQKRPKSSKSISGGRKYKPVNPHNISAENKLHSINHSIEKNPLLPYERPSSVTESLRYSKVARKQRGMIPGTNKDSISTSIDVPSIELHHQDGNFQKVNQAPNNIIYRKAAELIANNFHKNSSKNTAKTSSNSEKILRSTSRSGKGKKSKLKSQFKKNASNLDKSINSKKQQLHRKSKSDARYIAQEMFKSNNDRDIKGNSKLRKSNYIEQMLQERALVPRAVDIQDRESPLGMPQNYMVGKISQNWIDNINQQIEQNGKNLLDSINKVKQKNSSNSNSATRKTRKNKKNRPQSSHYVNVPHPATSNEAFKAMMNKKGNNEIVGKNIHELENVFKIDPNAAQHNRS